MALAVEWALAAVALAHLAEVVVVEEAVVEKAAVTLRGRDVHQGLDRPRVADRPTQARAEARTWQLSSQNLQ